MAATNQRELAALEGEMRRFTAQDSDPHMSSSMDNLCPVAKVIELKIGAQVCIQNRASVIYCIISYAFYINVCTR